MPTRREFWLSAALNFDPTHPVREGYWLAAAQGCTHGIYNEVRYVLV